MPLPDVSVVVPTRDRPAALERCLGALAAQTGVRTLEIVVVDDGSRAASEVAGVVAGFPTARLVRLEGQGPAAARNAGVAATRAPIVCFTDDDCVPHPEWASRLAAALEDDADAAGGEITTVEPASPFSVATRLVWLSLREPESGDHPYTAFLATGCLAARRDVLTEFPFDEDYRFASEDRDWCARLTSSGRRLARAPNALVVHHRTDGLASFWQRYVRYGEGAHRFRQLHSDGRPAAAGFYGRLLRAGFHESLSVGVLVCVSQAATAVGFARASLASHHP